MYAISFSYLHGRIIIIIIIVIVITIQGGAKVDSPINLLLPHPVLVLLSDFSEEKNGDSERGKWPVIAIQ